MGLDGYPPANGERSEFCCSRRNSNDVMGLELIQVRLDLLVVNDGGIRV
jgi:hypothetical protein